MSSFWFNLTYLIVVWGFGLYFKSDQVGLDSGTFFLSAFFFLLYFSLPLLPRRKSLITIILFLLTNIVFFTFYSVTFTGFSFLILLIIAVEATNHLRGFRLYFLLLIQYVVAIAPYIINGNLQLLAYQNLLIFLVSFSIYLWQRTNKSHISLKNAHEDIQNDYRKLKRHVVINEKNVRQEERNQIAREIHDSVGHRLTALLMQLEVVRLQAKDESDRNKISELKSLAQASLSETREAVQALKSEDTTGLTAVIQLIRKLESESHLQITFNIKAGALSFPLTNNQSVVLYRAVQEALTNMMRHSGSREAEVEFKVIGGSFFGFKISNPLKNKVEIVEGFGLTSMRERIEQLGGSLSLSQSEGRFTLTGSFPMEKGD